MGAPSSFSVGRAAGWALAAFVIGVAVHSADVLWHAPAGVWFVVLPMLALASAWTKSWMRVVFILALCFSLGVWRCDIAPKPWLQTQGGHTFLLRRHSSSDPGFFPRLRAVMTDRIHAIFSPRDASLIAGILYGDAQFTKADRDLFASAGLLHLVAVSGSNVTIVVGFLLQSFLAIRFSRRRAFIGVSIGLIAFVAFVGFGASVARAAFMGWLALTARFVGRIPSGSRLLLVAAAILCMIDPWQLAFDAGFALSFLAMWGIIRWAPIIEAHLSWLPNILGVRQALSATIAATVWTGPYLAWAFGRFSLAGLFTNLLALPLVPFFMTASGLAAAWGSLPGGAIVALPAAGCSSAVYFIAGLARSVPWLDFSVNMTTGACVATYAALIIFSSRLSAEKGLSTTKTGSTRFAEKNGDACQRAVTVVLQKSSVDSINAK